MPHYYFDLKDGKRLRDHRGIDLPDDATAIEHAKQLADSIASQNLSDPEQFVSVIRDDGQQVLQIPVRQYPDLG
jgi:hypothetical protein